MLVEWRGSRIGDGSHEKLDIASQDKVKWVYELSIYTYISTYYFLGYLVVPRFVIASLDPLSNETLDLLDPKLPRKFSML